MQDPSDLNTAQAAFLSVYNDVAIQSTEIASPQDIESNSPDRPDSPIQPSRASYIARSDDESVGQTPSPPPTGPEEEEIPTKSPQKPESAPSVEPEDDPGLDYAKLLASQTPTHDEVVGYIPRFYMEDPSTNILYPCAPGNPLALPFSVHPRPVLTCPIPPTPLNLYIPSGPSIAESSQSWNSAPLPASTTTPQPARKMAKAKWYSEVTGLSTQDFSHVEKSKNESPKFVPSYLALWPSPTDPRTAAAYHPQAFSYLKAQSTYAPSCSSFGAPTAIARSTCSSTYGGASPVRVCCAEDSRQRVSAGAIRALQKAQGWVGIGCTQATRGLTASR
ncbi:unnamed protein product [Clonostachys rosea]|uniref:Uncharacterized protein n=1 Tax=Bionectria ochroleuca TaxID=29856 RepID=A0ABY6TV38_BIOOC|nr:unnamed protein product [Clonostachys rosea]